MLLVSDVHGAFGALRRVAASAEPLLVLGDLVNLVDYRTLEGIVTDVVGRPLIEVTIEARTRGDDAAADAAWRAGIDGLGIDVRGEVIERMRTSYREMTESLTGADAYVIHGNVDSPEMLQEHLPPGVRYVDGQSVEIEGAIVGFAGGGVPRIGSRGEIDDDAMRAKLADLGTVDILCTHVAPALPMLAQDVIGGSSKGSTPVLEYIEEHEPAFHYFGDVHQPRATEYQHGATKCLNVGYFRATGRPVRHRAS